MLDENVSPAADQPDSRAVGQPLVTLDCSLSICNSVCTLDRAAMEPACHSGSQGTTLLDLLAIQSVLRT
eukprot:1159451-Pelagomonas_calceolata.AAC.4